ncbi:3-oxoacid CoA-transferase [Frisingicoccus caecimuris]|uniref:Propionate CoA-transferase n=1 Tax=Frisingicoccus caecimuris TaxID=1796636 RepID=A0A4V2SDS2_9FIRM|nr:CoA-transferase [Frisingicoccus caecimuris]MCR1918340.1 3-oxoacid CoA-transferase [Frisingicoccus caecimuris]TCO84988.1 propionate CoA-transferase [Frisingicoccus caecimuris]
MAKVKIITAAEAAAQVPDGAVINTEGFVQAGLSETLNRALEQRFLETGHPKDLTIFTIAGQGAGAGTGSDHFAHEGMVKRLIAGHYNLAPTLRAMAIEGKIEAYNLPQGTMAQMVRDAAGKRVGTITHVGLNTYVDPRIEGAKVNSKTTEDIVKLIEIEGEEKLLFKSQPLDVTFIRGTYADESGNISLEKECCTLDATSLAQCAKNNGGKVFVQVEKVVANGSLDPRTVKIPGIYVDAVIIAEGDDNAQIYKQEYDGSMTGDFRVPLGSLEAPKLDAKKIIARRAAMELQKGAVVNLGIGVPEFVSAVANEEGIGDWMTLTVEAGPVGGVPQGGSRFAGSVNVDCILDQPYQFDFYDGGGIDQAFLGLAQVDEKGNLNVSKFGGRIAGCGGFINISQNAKKVYYLGTFTTGGLKIATGNGKLEITQEGKSKKFVKEVEQITFSGSYAAKIGQPVIYITERAVFELRPDGVYLTEIAPGIDLQTQVLDLMDFAPKMDGEPKLMDARLFTDELMGLAE